ncbi:hypothetical protein VTO42DRAFT_4065 [Malbranchea cinnamomea]
MHTSFARQKRTRATRYSNGSARQNASGSHGDRQQAAGFCLWFFSTAVIHRVSVAVATCCHHDSSFASPSLESGLCPSRCMSQAKVKEFSRLLFRSKKVERVRNRFEKPQ